MKLSIIGVLFLVFQTARAQEKEGGLSTMEQQIENLALREDMETEDDALWQQLEYYRRHPLDLNEAGADDWRELQIVSDWQIAQLLRYRALFGSFISVYELQAVPGWDLPTIYRLLPFIHIGNRATMIKNLLRRMREGESSLLLRYGQVLEKARGFKENIYVGDPSAIFIRYKYQYKNLLQYGITAEKDAGEQFFGVTQPKGFDFYSFHFFARRLGPVKSLAIGDFTVNLGQGLIHWQSLAFKKSVSVLAVKRQSPVLRPYHAAGEFNFMRGAGITLQRKQWEATLFASGRKMDAHTGSDTTGEAAGISSLSAAGYHRTVTELAAKNQVQLYTAGANVKWSIDRAHVALNTVHHRLSLAFQPSGDPWQRYNITGRVWSNYSIDYSYTVRNMHWYGEMAVDQNGEGAWVQGLMVSVATRADLAIVYRRISGAYRTLFGNAFTENTLPVNERGLYAGLTVRPAPGWQVNAFADLYRFPWLKYRVDAPSAGREYLLQITFTPNKQVEMYSSYRLEEKVINSPGMALPTRQPVAVPKKNWRTQMSWQLNPSVLLRSRVETLWYDVKNSQGRETGFLWLLDVQYRTPRKAWQVQGRLQFFETDGYNSRIYAYENSVLYSFSIPALYGAGCRYYVAIRWRLQNRWRAMSHRKNDCMLSVFFAQTRYRSGSEIGSGYGAIEGGRKSELRLQWVMNLR